MSEFRTFFNFHHKLPWIVRSRVVLHCQVGYTCLDTWTSMFRYRYLFQPQNVFLLIQIIYAAKAPASWHIIAQRSDKIGAHKKPFKTACCVFILERADCLSAGCLTRCTGGWWPAAASGRSPSAACTSCPASAGERASQSRYEQSVPWFCNISSNILDANNVVTWVKDVVN